MPHCTTCPTLRQYYLNSRPHRHRYPPDPYGYPSPTTSTSPQKIHLQSVVPNNPMNAPAHRIPIEQGHCSGTWCGPTVQGAPIAPLGLQKWRGDPRRGRPARYARRMSRMGCRSFAIPCFLPPPRLTHPLHRPSQDFQSTARMTRCWVPSENCTNMRGSANR